MINMVIISRILVAQNILYLKQLGKNGLNFTKNVL